MTHLSNVAFMQQVKTDSPPLNTFDLSHEVKLTTDFGKITPCLIAEVVPGDKINLHSELFTRFAPMTFPVMHKISATIHYFFVPYRLLFEDWETFYTGGRNGDGKNEQGVTAVLPHLVTNSTNITSIKEGSLADYLGLPTPIATGLDVQLMPFRAYQIICNEWYRNQNVKAPYIDVTTFKKGGVVSDTNFKDQLNVLRNKDWERDLFTSALPWTQRGQIASFGGGDVLLKTEQERQSTMAYAKFVRDNTVPWQTDVANAIGAGQNSNQIGKGSGTIGTGQPVAQVYDPNGTLKINPVDLNTFRQAVRMQELFELLARTGARYYEAILGEFGVRSPDARLQRPEYIGGGRTPVQISEVVSTAQTEDRKLGDFAGHAIAVGTQNSGYYEATEFGYVMGLLSFAPCSGYMQGVERHWLKNDRFDYLHPKLAHLGERPVYNAEIYGVTGATNPLGTFGYQPQYAEYRTINSRSAGNFRSTMRTWHLDRYFESQPTLSADFLDCDPVETSRIFNVTDPNVHHLWCQIQHNITMKRPLPLFGEPSL